MRSPRSAHAAARLVRVVIVPSALVGAIYFALGACGGASSSSPSPPPAPTGPMVPAPVVHTVVATSEDVPETLDVPAQLDPRTVAHATAPRAGTVGIVMHVVGDVVQRGDALAALQAEGHGRATNVPAPMSGVVIEVPVHLGDHVDAHAPVATVGDLSGISVHGRVPAARADAVRPAMPAQLVVSSMPDRVFATTISGVAPIADANGDVELDAMVENVDGMLRPGTPATLHVVLATHAGAIVVPAAAVIVVSDDASAAVVDAGHARIRHVRVGLHVGDRVEILSGLAVGDRVILAPEAVVDGQEVDAR